MSLFEQIHTTQKIVRKRGSKDTKIVDMLQVAMNMQIVVTFMCAQSTDYCMELCTKNQFTVEVSG